MPLQGHITVAGFGFGLFERTWTLRGFNNALMDAAGDPDFYAALVERGAAHQMEIKALQPETPTPNAVAVVEAFLRQAGVTLL